MIKTMMSGFGVGIAAAMGLTGDPEYFDHKTASTPGPNSRTGTIRLQLPLSTPGAAAAAYRSTPLSDVQLASS
jgi:hypothetical protein